MTITRITADNLGTWKDYIDEAASEWLNRPLFKVYGALDDDGNASGLIAYELMKSTKGTYTKSRVLFLKGDDEVKSALLSEYASLIEEDEVAVSLYETEDADLAHTLHADGFSLAETESHDLLLTMDDVKTCYERFHVKQYPSYIKGLSDVPILMFRGFVKECLSKGQHGLLEDLAFLPEKWYDMSLSSCIVSGDTMQGALLVKNTGGSTLYPLLFTAFDTDFQKKLALMMAYSCEKVLASCSDDTRILIRRHNATVKKLTDSFFKGKKGAKVYTGSRKEWW